MWSVADESTSELMQEFYARLISGDSPGQALQDVRREFIEQNRTPFTWAPFVLIGGAE